MKSGIYHGGGSGGGGFSGGGGSAPTELVVTYSASITINAAVADVFEIVLTGNPTLNAPTNPAAAKKIIIRLVQDGTGGRTVTWNAAFRFGVSLPSPILSVTALLHDYIAFVYNGVDSKWDCIGQVFGV